MKIIRVHSQEEFNAIPNDCQDHIFIEFGTKNEPAIVDRSFYYPVIVDGEYFVEARNNSFVCACGRSHVKVYDESEALSDDINIVKYCNEKNEVSSFENICKELHDLYERKNKDYGDSFHLSFMEEGMAMSRIRIGDKFNRFKTLTKGEQAEVKDESIRDTLMDLANYAIMTIIELDKESTNED